VKKKTLNVLQVLIWMIVLENKGGLGGGGGDEMDSKFISWLV
jgi:hypothetical protein